MFLNTTDIASFKIVIPCILTFEFINWSIIIQINPDTVRPTPKYAVILYILFRFNSINNTIATPVTINDVLLAISI